MDLDPPCTRTKMDDRVLFKRGDLVQRFQGKHLLDTGIVKETLLEDAWTLAGLSEHGERLVQYCSVYWFSLGKEQLNRSSHLKKAVKGKQS